MKYLGFDFRRRKKFIIAGAVASVFTLSHAQPAFAENGLKALPKDLRESLYEISKKMHLQPCLDNLQKAKKDLDRYRTPETAKLFDASIQADLYSCQLFDLEMRDEFGLLDHEGTDLKHVCLEGRKSFREVPSRPGASAEILAELREVKAETLKRLDAICVPVSSDHPGVSANTYFNIIQVTDEIQTRASAASGAEK
jgi:hypothetical protein